MDLSSINIINLIKCLRLDLRKKFFLKKNIKLSEFLKWVISSGIHEYELFNRNSELIGLLNNHLPNKQVTVLQEIVWQSRKDVRQTFNFSIESSKFIQWFYVHGVGEHNLWPWISDYEREHVCKLVGPWQASFLQKSNEIILETPKDSRKKFTPGVNLIGYVHGEIGIGEDVRMAALALNAVEIPVSIVNFLPGNMVPQNDMTFIKSVVEFGDKYVNIFCLSALEHGRFYAQKGLTQLNHKYNIGYWPWELSQWPTEWLQFINLVDEIWVSSKYTMSAIVSHCESLKPPIKVVYMPMAVSVQANIQKEINLDVTRSHTRKILGLTDKSCLFCFSFDINSSIYRKNPEALIKAFLKAFPNSEFDCERVGLVIKIHPPQRSIRAWSELKELAKNDNRVHIFEQTMPRSELLAMYQACDAYVSLHRAEGFGRGIAEALQLGLRVITTDYSGNVDFCRLSEFTDRVKLIPYKLIKVRPGQYPHGNGQEWASPKIDAAAKAMREIEQEVKKNKGSLLPVPERGWPVFCEKEIGTRYKKRLDEIFREIY
jgi:glycosyltransferase involved in cell wall biosynthesis